MSDSLYLGHLRAARQLVSKTWDFNSGKMHPEVSKVLVREIQGVSLKVVWEPFAGHGGYSRSADVFAESGIKHIAYDLAPTDSRIQKADSTIEGPQEPIGAMLWHPPYFGAASMSKEAGELSLLSDETEYIEALQRTAILGCSAMVSGGLTFAISRRYYAKGCHIRLDEWFLSVLRTGGLELVKVWLATPDVILVMRKEA